MDKARPALILLAVAAVLFFATKGADMAAERWPQAAAAADILNARSGDFVAHRAEIVSASPQAFAYAHATVMSHGKIFIGMADINDNPFKANDIFVFPDPSSLDAYMELSIPEKGDIQTMIYEPVSDSIYFIMSNGSDGLEAYSLNPNDYSFKKIYASSTIDVGRKPAIVADKDFIYGITNTEPSKVFRIRLSDGSITLSSHGHIPSGHSAAIGMNGTSTELYFGGGMSGWFEKDDAATLKPVRSIHLNGCVLTDDMPYQRLDYSTGYVYVGCEATPEGYRVRTSNLERTQFALPGRSFGMFINGGDLYNGAFDSTIDVFPNEDIGDLHRYYITNAIKYAQSPGDDLHVNELIFPPNGGIYMTSWWDVKGLFKVELK